jgi:hypothetical protein
MMRTLYSLSHVPAGFRSDGVLTMRVQPTGERFNTSARQLEYVGTLLDRAGCAPGRAVRWRDSSSPAVGLRVVLEHRARGTCAGARRGADARRVARDRGRLLQDDGHPAGAWSRIYRPRTRARRLRS